MGEGGEVGQQKQKTVEGDMAIQNKNPSKKQSIGEAKAITRCTTRTSTKHAGRPAKTHHNWVVSDSDGCWGP
jgi:hypothetical protein